MQISYMKDGQTRSLFVQSDDSKVRVLQEIARILTQYPDNSWLVHGHPSR